MSSSRAKGLNRNVMNYARSMQFVAVLYVLWNLLEDFRIEILYSSLILFPHLFN